MRDAPLPGWLTVREVALNNDYSVATVIYVVTGAGVDDTQARLQSQAAALRARLAQNLNMRKTPTLVFQYDSEGLAADKMREWLDGINTENTDNPDEQ